MVEAAFAIVPSVLPSASFKNIANIAYALAILSHRPPEALLTSVAEAAVLRMPSASSQASCFCAVSLSLHCVQPVHEADSIFCQTTGFCAIADVPLILKSCLFHAKVVKDFVTEYCD